MDFEKREISKEKEFSVEFDLKEPSRKFSSSNQCFLIFLEILSWKVNPSQAVFIGNGTSQIL